MEQRKYWYTHVLTLWHGFGINRHKFTFDVDFILGKYKNKCKNVFNKDLADKILIIDSKCSCKVLLWKLTIWSD